MTKKIQDFDKTLHDKELSNILQENKDLQLKLENLRNDVCSKSERSLLDLQQKSDQRVKEYEDMMKLYQQSQPLSETLLKERDSLQEQLDQLQQANESLSSTFAQEQEYSTKLEEIIDLYERITGINVLEKNDRFKLSRNGFQFYMAVEGEKIKYSPGEEEKDLPANLSNEMEFGQELSAKFMDRLFKFT